MTTLYLIRHGETDNNLKAHFNGQKANQPLKEKGCAQAACLAAPFAEIKPDVILASPLRRAMATAEGLRGDLPLVIEPAPDLLEMDMGIYDGVSFEEVWRIAPFIMENWAKGDPALVQMPEGENFTDAQNRVTAALVRIVREYRGKTVAAVAHGTLFQLFFLRLFGLPLKEKWRIPVLHNTGYGGLGIEDDGSVRVLCYDAMAHLSEDQLRGNIGKSSGHDYVGKTLHFAEFQK